MQTVQNNPNEGKSELSELIRNSFETKSRTGHGDLKRKHVKSEVLKMFSSIPRNDV